VTRKIPFFIVFIACLLGACSIPTTSMPASGHPRILSPSPTLAGTQDKIQALPPSISTGGAPFTIAWDDPSLFRKNVTSSYQKDLERMSGASVYHLALSLSDPPAQIIGIEEVLYTNTENVGLSEVDFAIFPEILGGKMEVNSISQDGRLVSPIVNTGIMRIKLSNVLEPKHSTIFHIEFSITVPHQGEDFYYGIFGLNEGVLSLAHAYPTILVYNESGWNNQPPDLDGDPLFSDISFYLVSINAPANWTLVASGIEVDRHKSAGRQQILYADGPARDFYLAASKDFEKRSEKKGETTINSYAPASLSGFADSALSTGKAAMDDFSNRYAPYPYTEFDIVPIITTAGGVEFPGIVALAERIYSDGGYLESVVAHEISHQWFYNLVGNSTQLQPWLDESLSQFVTWQYYLDRYGNTAAQACLDAMKSRWDRIDNKKIPIGDSVPAYSSDEYSAIVYGRGPMFFLALRQEIGQATFDSVLKEYTNTFSWKIATTEDFKNMAEKHCKCNLTSLFQEWVQPGE
jgi:hypothetical protein